VFVSRKRLAQLVSVISPLPHVPDLQGYVKQAGTRRAKRGLQQLA
jgi:hypothetical protein